MLWQNSIGAEASSLKQVGNTVERENGWIPETFKKQKCEELLVKMLREVLAEEKGKLRMTLGFLAIQLNGVGPLLR